MKDSVWTIPGKVLSIFILNTVAHSDAGETFPNAWVQVFRFLGLVTHENLDWA